MFARQLHQSIVEFIGAATTILYLVIALGLSLRAPQYLETFQNWAKIYVSLFLLYQFHPFRTAQFTKLDGKIAFMAGTFLFTSTVAMQLIWWYIIRWDVPLLANLGEQIAPQ